MGYMYEVTSLLHVSCIITKLFENVSLRTTIYFVYLLSMVSCIYHAIYRWNNSLL